MAIAVDRLGDMTRIKFDLPTVGAEQWFLLRSDAHHDSPIARNGLEKRHLEQAAERGAGVLDFGDLFDAMQGPHDPRRSIGGRKADHMTDSYFNVLLDDAESFYAPFAQNIILLGVGNHEEAVIKNCGFDLTRELVRRLNTAHGATVQRGGYHGWVRFQATYCGTCVLSYDMYYTHGSGGGAPVTEGKIQMARRGNYAPDADIIVAGHIHAADKGAPGVWRCNQKGVVDLRKRLAIQLPGYMGHSDWAASRGHNPPLIHGASWLVFRHGKKGQIDYCETEAESEPMRWTG